MNPRSLYIEDEEPVVLLLIDPQVDFHEGGSLAVPGSTEDSHRISDMIRKNIKNIDEVFVTLDSHHKKHIAHASFWSDKPNDKEGAGKVPDVFTTIKHADILAKKWYPRDCALQNYVQSYTKKLEDKKHFCLTIWPDHCLIGTTGHSIADEIQDAIVEWSVEHNTKTVKHIFKGMNCLTEMYSAVEAEVPVESDATTTKNHELCSELRKAKRLIICGQAKSHCVNYTARDIIRDWKRHRETRDRLHDIYVLEDGCSSVGDVPGTTTFADASAEFIADLKKDNVTVTTCDKAFVGLPVRVDDVKNVGVPIMNELKDD